MPNSINDIILNDYATAINETSPQTLVGGTPVNEYDYVLSFFSKVITDEESAANFAQILYEISLKSEIPVMTLLETLRDQDLLTLTASMAYYLNGVRSSAVLVGVENIIKPNYYAARNVLD